MLALRQSILRAWVCGIWIAFAITAVACIDDELSDGEPYDDDRDGSLAALAARPDFQAPFPCGQSWTYSHHSMEVRRALDFVKNGGGTNGAPVIASFAGTATRHVQAEGAGNYIKVDHGGGWQTYYFHLQSFSVASGVAVQQGQEIGRTGTTGASSGPHIHYEQLLNGVGQDIIINGVSLTPYPSSYGQRSLTSANCGGGGGGAGAGITPNDVNGDGRADLVTSHSDGDAYVYAGSATGTFSTRTTNFAGTLNSSLHDGTGHLLIGVGDVTGDRRGDLVGLHASGSVAVWPGGGDLKFGYAVSSFEGTMKLATLTTHGHDPVGVADVTGDGRADLITVHSHRHVYVYPGTASGMFGSGVPSFSGTFDNAFHDGVGHWVVGVADVTGDRLADLVTVHSNGSAYVYPGRADATFGAYKASFASSMPLATIDGTGHLPVGVADVTGDGRADLVTAHTDGTAYVSPGQSTGAFGAGIASFRGTLSIGQFGAPGQQVVGVMDTTGDGHADLITAFEGNARVYPGKPTGEFSSYIINFMGTLDSSFTDGVGFELMQMGPYPRRRVCSASTGCRAP